MTKDDAFKAGLQIGLTLPVLDAACDCDDALELQAMRDLGQMFAATLTGKSWKGAHRQDEVERDNYPPQTGEV